MRDGNRDISGHTGKHIPVVSLPMRDGNEESTCQSDLAIPVVSLPMRDGNLCASMQAYPSGRLLAYL